MNYRYFIPVDPPNDDRLARVDTERGAAQLLVNGQNWRETNSLLRLTLTDDNLDWEEIDATKAARLERRLAS